MNITNSDNGALEKYSLVEMFTDILASKNELQKKVYFKFEAE